MVVYVTAGLAHRIECRPTGITVWRVWQAEGVRIGCYRQFPNRVVAAEFRDLRDRSVSERG